MKTGPLITGLLAFGLYANARAFKAWFIEAHFYCGAAMMRLGYIIAIFMLLTWRIKFVIST